MALAEVYELPVQPEPTAELAEVGSGQMFRELGSRALRYFFYKLYHEPQPAQHVLAEVRPLRQAGQSYPLPETMD